MTHTEISPSKCIVRYHSEHRFDVSPGGPVTDVGRQAAADKIANMETEEERKEEDRQDRMVKAIERRQFKAKYIGEKAGVVIDGIHDGYPAVAMVNIESALTFRAGGGPIISRNNLSAFSWDELTILKSLNRNYDEAVVLSAMAKCKILSFADFILISLDKRCWKAGLEFATSLGWYGPTVSTPGTDYKKEAGGIFSRRPDQLGLSANFVVLSRPPAIAQTPFAETLTDLDTPDQPPTAAVDAVAHGAVDSIVRPGASAGEEDDNPPVPLDREVTHAIPAVPTVPTTTVATTTLTSGIPIAGWRTSVDCKKIKRVKPILQPQMRKMK
ncbi:hypothetical protein MMC18_007578 [Xylographa bjoerkii]|nr:hypothetical protein [Xylographa bjoerkii]